MYTLAWLARVGETCELSVHIAHGRFPSGNLLSFGLKMEEIEYESQGINVLWKKSRKLIREFAYQLLETIIVSVVCHFTICRWIWQWCWPNIIDRRVLEFALKRFTSHVWLTHSSFYNILLFILCIIHNLHSYKLTTSSNYC